jgi:hypothetical protein
LEELSAQGKYILSYKRRTRRRNKENKKELFSKRSDYHSASS